MAMPETVPATEFAPRRIYWEVTRGCNLRCVHCRAAPLGPSSPDDLPTEACLAIMDEIAMSWHPVVVLTGGEPLLRPDIYELGRYGARKGFRMGLATNGTLVNDRVADRIAASGFRRVSVSLDGADAASHDQFRRVPGAFEATLQGVQALKDAGLSVQVNTSIATHNANRLDEMLELVLGLGADAWHLFMLVPVGCGLEIAESMQIGAAEYERILHWLFEKSGCVSIDLRAVCAPHYFRVQIQRRMQARDPQSFGAAHPDELDWLRRSLAVRRGCLAGYSMCFISHKGEVFPCGYLPVKAGDLRTEGFEAIWHRSTVFQDLRDPDLLAGRCGWCEYRVVCGGCRARAYGMSGDYLGEEPFCSYFCADRGPAPGSSSGIQKSEGSMVCSWSDEAEVELHRVPEPLRPAVIRQVEAYARRHRVGLIGAEIFKRAMEHPEEG